MEKERRVGEGWERKGGEKSEGIMVGNRGKGKSGREGRKRAGRMGKRGKR